MYDGCLYTGPEWRCSLQSKRGKSSPRVGERPLQGPFAQPPVSKISVLELVVSLLDTVHKCLPNFLPPPPNSCNWTVKWRHCLGSMIPLQIPPESIHATLGIGKHHLLALGSE